MDKHFYEIKLIAKQKLSGHFGLALLVTFIPAIVYGVLGGLAGFIFGIISTDLGDLVDALITGYGTFVSISLIVQLFRGKTNFTSEDFFFFDERVIQYFLLSLILFALGFTVFIPFYDQFQSISSVPFSMLGDNAYLRSLIESITPAQIIGSLIATIITLYLSVRLIFAPYIIVDQKLKVLEAIKKSWQYTSGKFWYLFFFPLSFILWFLLLIPTLFLVLIYLVPYIAFSYAALYFEFKKASGDEDETVFEKHEEVIEVDILDDDIYR